MGAYETAPQIAAAILGIGVNIPGDVNFLLAFFLDMNENHVHYPFLYWNFMTSFKKQLEEAEKTEGVKLQAMDNDGNLVDPKLPGIKSYPYKKALGGDKTVAQLKQRLGAWMPGTVWDVSDHADSQVAHGNNKLKTLRPAKK